MTIYLLHLHYFTCALLRHLNGYPVVKQFSEVHFGVCVSVLFGIYADNVYSHPISVSICTPYAKMPLYVSRICRELQPDL